MFIADLHIHSKYSRATSKECMPEYLDLWARRKGLDLIGTGDFTHPVWREELKEKFVPAEDGLYRLKDDFRIAETVGDAPAPRFVISGEISSIYKKNGRVRKVHNVILLPSLEAGEALSHRLELIGNLHSDGRPILGLDSHDLLEITLDTCPDAIFIPAHIWTPHFSLFGAYSGFDTIEECFEDLTPHIHALETGLSSDPPMNWRLSALDRFTMVSNSDAHSPANLAREANLFNTELSYPSVARALASHDTDEFYGTLEFFPEEGKYHNDGHRNCKVCLTPEETIAAGGKCPVCGRRITVGVYHRVVELADREAGFKPENAKHFESIVPLPEVIAASMGMTTASKKVKAQYEDILHKLGPELHILREAPIEDIKAASDPFIAEGIRRLRSGEVEIHPGYDGEYGKILVMNKDERSLFAGQLSLFGAQEKNIRQAPFSPVRKTSGETSVSDMPEQIMSGHPYGLNAEQWMAACAKQPTVAVLAGPGTGKTRTLICRIAYLIEECGVDPAKITAVTFTNKAATEMRERLGKYFHDKKIVKAMHIGTFHSICLDMLCAWNKNITVIDQNAALSVLSDVLKACNCSMRPREALSEISRVKNGAAGDVPLVVYDAYCARLRQLNVVDFDDILLDTLARFEDGDTKMQAFLPRFSHLLVDEFQDINPVQYRLIHAWNKQGDLFVIGDPDQSIYGFRGSDAQCFARLHEDLAPVYEIRLKDNYRSTPQIINCALHAIGRNEKILEAKRESSAAVRLLTVDSSFSEALFLAKEINHMVGGVDMLAAHAKSKKHTDAQYGPGDIAVLYRTHRQSEIIEECLKKEGVPYVVAGRDDSLSDRRVMGALAFFRFLCNPKDCVSLTTYLKSASVPPASMQAVLEKYGAGKQCIASLTCLLRELGESKNADMLEKFAPLLRRESPEALLSMWVGEQDFKALPQPLQRLINTAVLHERMDEFLKNLTLGKEGDVRRSGHKAYTSDAVTLMTLHASKGLEFPVVFLCGVNERTIPFCNEKHKSDLEEERRLFYVGLTRAQNELVLLADKQEPSPFLNGFPKQSIIEAPAFAHKKNAVKQLGFF